MTFLRNSLIALFAAFTLAACGTFGDEEPEQYTASEIEEAEDAELNATAIEEDEPEVSEEIVALVIELRQSANQEELETNIGSALVNGFTEEEVAQAIGIATFRTPRRRVLLSVTYVRFRAASRTPANDLDEVYEYWSTPPRLRDVEEVEEEEAEEEAEPVRRRRRGFFSWIPGL